MFHAQQFTEHFRGIHQFWKYKTAESSPQAALSDYLQSKPRVKVH